MPLASYRLTARARLAEVRGAGAEALELAAQLVGTSHIPMMSAIGSGICLRLGEPALARRLADAAIADQTQPYSRAYAILTLALLDWRLANSAEAHRRLEECLALTTPERVRFPFIDNAGTACTEILAAHASCTGYPDFLDECLSACERAMTAEVPQNGALTPRERQVLSHLRKQMTSNEIAQQMAVSVNTIKTHQRAIYRKLGVANRRESIRLGMD